MNCIFSSTLEGMYAPLVIALRQMTVDPPLLLVAVLFIYFFVYVVDVFTPVLTLMHTSPFS